MSLPDLLKNITSKDINLSKNTIKDIIKSCDIKAFQELCEKAEFIFPFLKERIINDFVKLINENDLAVVFEFSKIYSTDFEDLIVKSWLKFANEDLTDKILEIFENGSDSQKAYAARYFFHIKDSLALDILKKNAFSDFPYLRINCARTLAAFNDFSVRDEMMEKILKTDDEFEKLSAFEFIIATGGTESLKFTLEHCFNSSFASDIISNILDFNEFFDLKKILKENEIARIFGVLTENYPENIPLDTITYYSVLDFIKYLKKSENPYSINVLAIAKKNFEEYHNNEIYSFDLDKNTKDELKKIVETLKDFEPIDIINFTNLKQELLSFEQYRYEAALKTVEMYKISDMVPFISDLINSNNLPLNLFAQSVQTVACFKRGDLINKDSIENITNENIKALVKSYLV